MRFACVIFILVVSLLASGAEALELITPRGTGMGRTVSLSRPSAAWQVNVPTRGLAPGDWSLEGGYNRRFELADLDHLFLATAARWRQLTVAVGASQFGKTELYAEQLLKGSLAFHYDSLSVAASVSAMQVQLGNNYGQLRAVTAGIGLSYRYRRLLLAATADNLTRPALTDYSDKIQPVYGLYAELVGKEAYSVSGRVTLEDLQKPRFGLGQIIRLSRRGSFFWGVSTSPMEFGGGLEVNIPSGSLTYATSVHPVLGFSHTVSFAYGSSRRTSKGADEFK
ncbi:MAG: hypothetical protein GY867_09065 [bacterium]|nr:hypothetical protein [bacterium]